MTIAASASASATRPCRAAATISALSGARVAHRRGIANRRAADSHGARWPPLRASALRRPDFEEYRQPPDDDEGAEADPAAITAAARGRERDGSRACLSPITAGTFGARRRRRAGMRRRRREPRRREAIIRHCSCWPWRGTACRRRLPGACRAAGGGGTCPFPVDDTTAVSSCRLSRRWRRARRAAGAYRPAYPPAASRTLPGIMA